MLNILYIIWPEYHNLYDSVIKLTKHLRNENVRKSSATI